MLVLVFLCMCLCFYVCVFMLVFVLMLVCGRVYGDGMGLDDVAASDFDVGGFKRK